MYLSIKVQSCNSQCAQQIETASKLEQESKLYQKALRVVPELQILKVAWQLQMNTSRKQLKRANQSEGNSEAKQKFCRDVCKSHLNSVYSEGSHRQMLPSGKR